jgi:hypothetical protein
MPGGDRTGPVGLGQRTGRGAGFCSGSSTPGYKNPGLGIGRGYGRGRGLGQGYWGRGRGFWKRDVYDPFYRPQYYDIGTNPQPSKDEEKVYLEETVKNLEEEIKNMKNRIRDLSKEKKE